MRQLLLACALLVAVAQAAVPNRVVRSVGHRDGDKCYCSWRGGGAPWGDNADMIEGRLEGQGMRLDKLAEKLEALQKKADDKIHRAEGLVKQFRTVEARVKKIEGSDCKVDEFECGSPAYTCVHEMHMCDGVNDCPNHADEDKHQCVNYMPAGAVFEGHIHGEDHCTKRQPHKIRAVVTSVRSKTWFPGVPKTMVSVLLYYKHGNEERVDTLAGHGTWDFAHHRLLVNALEADGLALACKFDGVNADRCEASIFNENSGRGCLKFTMHEVHH